jgi:hypothetical protein
VGTWSRDPAIVLPEKMFFIRLHDKFCPKSLEEMDEDKKYVPGDPFVEMFFKHA